MDDLGRLPDFLIIGVMKSGSTTLFRWLAEHPGVWFPGVKEPEFFSHDKNWNQGLESYAEMFAATPPGLRTGEASTAYTKPTMARASAQRIADTMPDVKMIAMLRHPVGRLRSQYRHEIQKGREHRPLVEALSDPKTQYLPQSHYHRVLLPYLELFPSGQLLIVRIDDLTSDDQDAWNTVLDHLELQRVPRPAGAYNVTAAKPRNSRMLRQLSDRGLLKRTDVVPKLLRRAVRPFLQTDPSDPAYREQLEGSTVPIPDELLASMWLDVAELEEVLGRELWRPGDESER